LICIVTPDFGVGRCVVWSRWLVLGSLAMYRDQALELLKDEPPSMKPIS